ncbi:MAG: histone deacetylase family protein [Deltaproteobacteria bacterium]|nr:MAG: histone deacetylase family protein [Deltaproteobacteria bacterium]
MQPLEVVYHPKYEEDYPTASVESPERVRVIRQELEGNFNFVIPEAASEEDILLVHTHSSFQEVKGHTLLFEVASLAVGGAIKAAHLAWEGTPAFGLIRPPGHHASPGSHWGFCFFNNIAIAVEKLIREGKVERVLIMDIDLHFGDGTHNFFQGRNDVVVENIQEEERNSFLHRVDETLESSLPYDLIAISAGFDRYRLDWGGTLEMDDYRIVGERVAEKAMSSCHGRRFAILEGGYYIPDLGKNARSLVDGLTES